MSEILIDGYNLLNASPSFFKDVSKSLENARNLLISRLAGYKKIKNYKITVIFDGQESYPTEAFVSGIRVIFTPGRQKADDKIKMMSREKSGYYIVVTSDREIADTVRKHGSVVIGSAEFSDKVNLAHYRYEKGVDTEEDEPRTGKNKKGLSLRLPKKERLMQRRLSKL